MKNYYFTLCKKIIAGIGGFCHWIGPIRLHIVLESISKMHLGYNQGISARPPSRGSSYLSVRIAPAAAASLRNSSISLPKPFLRWVLVITAIVMLFQIINVPVVHADYGINKTNNVIARMINAPVNLTASVFDGVRSFLNTVSGGVIGGRAQAIDGHAIREKNRGTPITSEEGTTTPSVNINAVTGFTQNVEFSTGFTSGAGATINGLLRGEEINLGGGKITASNVLYGLTSGDGIEVGGNTQRPTISSNLWRKENTTIVTRDPLLSLAIGSNLTVGANLAMGANLTIGTSTTGSLISLSGTSTTVYNAFATTTVARNLINAWSIAGSATGTPIISIDSRGSGSIGIGTLTPSGKLTIKNSQVGSIAFQITAADGQQADLFEINDALNKSLLVVDGTGRLGIGTNVFNAALTVASTSYFSGPLTASSSVYLAVNSGRVGIGTLDPKQTLSVKGTFDVTGDARFGTSPLLTSITNCSGNGVLETDGDGRITCGQDEVGSGGSPPVVIPDKGEVQGSTVGFVPFYSGGNTVRGTATIFYDSASTRLGIGTTTPFSILSIATSSRPQFLLSDPSASTDLKHWYASSTLGSLTFGTVADSLATSSITEKIRITNAGLFGIGTTTPGSLLSVQGVANFAVATSTIYSTLTLPVINATSTIATSTFGNGIQISGGCFRDGTGSCVVSGGSGGSGTVNTGTANRLAYYSTAANSINSIDFLAVDATNNLLGIGTTTPGSRLSIQGVGNFVNAATSTFYTNLSLPYIYATSTTATSSFAGPLYIASSTPTGSALFAVGTSSPLFWIDRNTGNIGIGTSSPSAKFAFTGDGTGATRAFVIADSANTERVSILNNGNVGIGTAAPTRPLQIHNSQVSGGESNAAIRLSQVNMNSRRSGDFPIDVFAHMANQSASEGRFQITGMSGVNGGTGLILEGYIGQSDPADTTAAVLLAGSKWSGGTGSAKLGSLETVFEVRNGDVTISSDILLSILGGGNVGIGTTSPGSFLSVQAGNAQITGTTTASALVATSTLFVGATGDLFNVMQSGRVGIGTTSPGSLLSVQGGNAQITGTTTAHALVATSTLLVTGSGTSTLVQAIQATGLSLSSSGLTITGGGLSNTTAGTSTKLQAFDATLLNLTGSATSTITAGLRSAGLHTTAGLEITAGGLLNRTSGTSTQLQAVDATLLNITSTAASSTFSGGIVAAGGLRLTNLNCTGLANSGSLTTNTLGDVVCDDDTSASGTINSGTPNRLTFYSAATTLNSADFLGIYTTSAPAPRFGIGTSSPYAALSVTSTSSPQFILTDYPNDTAKTTHWFASTTIGNLAFGVINNINTGTTTYLTIASSTGRIGIGTTSPGSLLSVQAGNAQITGTTTAHALIATSTLFVGATGNLFNVMQSGNIGIGTTSPGSLLSVQAGNAQITGTTTTHALVATSTLFVGGSTGSSLYVGQSGHVGIGTTNPRSLIGFSRALDISNTTLPAVALHETSSGAEAGIGLFDGLRIDSGGNSTASNNFISFRTTNTASSYAPLTEQMRIQSDGFVGIGISLPLTTLHVVSSDGTYGGSIFENTDTGSGSFFSTLTNARRTSTAGAGVGFAQLMYNSSSALAEYAYVGAIIESNAAGSQSGSIVFAPRLNNVRVEAMRITSAGNVGIGTTTPGSLLSIQGVGNFVNAATSTLYTNLRLPFITATSTIATSSFAGPLYIGSSTPNGSAFFAVGTSSPLLWVDRNSGNVTIGTTTSGEAKFVVSSTSTQPTAELVGTTQAVYPLTVFNTAPLGNNVLVSFNTDETKILRGFINFDRSLVLVRYNTSSDIRLKNDLGLASDTTVLRDLKIHRFTWKETGSESIGVFAQEAYPVKPGAISAGTDEMDAQGNLMRPWGVDYSTYVPDLIVGWQELNSRTSFISASTTVPRMFVDSSGNIGIGTTTPDYTLRVEGDIAAQSFINISTRGAKEDIKTLEKKDEEKLFDSLIKTQTATYHYKGENEKNSLHLGLIAEDAPDAIRSANGKGIDLYKMATALLAGMKVQQEKLEKLDAAIHGSSTTPAALAANAWSIDQTNGKVNVGFLGNINLENNAILDVKNITGYLGKWSIDEDGTIIAVKIITDEMITKKLAISESATFGSVEHPIGITIYDEVTKEPYCMKMHSGAMVSIAGVCGSFASGDNSALSTPTPMPTPSLDSSSEPSLEPLPSSSPEPSLDIAPIPPPSLESSPFPRPSPSESATPSPEP